jgi:phage terminase large subunit
MANEKKLIAEIPESLAFLYEPAEIKAIVGGRGKGASWGIADALLTLGTKRPLRWLCTRETMESIEESTHATLSSRIVALGLQDEYEVQQRKILSRRWAGGAEQGDPLAGRYGFSFAGLYDNAKGLKSYEGYDGCWLAEAQELTKASWLNLVPTFRKDPPAGPFGDKGVGSEIWVDFNPQLDTDFAWERFVLNPSPRMKVVRISWRDNPFFPQKLRDEMEEMRRDDPDSYEHVYEGVPASNIKGAVFLDEMKRVDMDQRIGSVPYGPGQPVLTFWDVGLDTTAIWFLQARAMQIALIDYYENKGKGIDHYAQVLQSRGYVYGQHWLPWDVGVQAAPQGMGAGKSLEFILRGYGFDVRSSPRWVNTQVAINAARQFFPRCHFDGLKCEAGIRGLRRYQWGDPPKSGATTRQPLHDWASHPAAAFQYAAGNFAPAEPEEERPRPAPSQWGFGDYTPMG